MMEGGEGVEDTSKSDDKMVKVRHVQC
jgi:hypothetical protein